MGRTCKLHTERTWSASNPGPSCCEATELTTEPPCLITKILFMQFNNSIILYFANSNGQN
ncbi:hypothetical protein LDENG_00274560 [Lucifuga dentata]|nr:hypothetical protein LDENG_00274560 [Lucifuga dentata]